jgi:cytochrome c oxidase subunit 2
VHYLSTTTSDIAVSANEIHLPVGRPMNIQLESQDVIHSFWVPRLHGKVDLIPQVVNRIRIQADEAGTYRGQCAEFCGPQHAHMILQVVAEPPADYQQWLQHERQPAPAPAGAELVRGQQLFESNACVLCHTIRGTHARGKVGPDLTHFGRRLGVAANMMPNDIASVAAWITHAQSLKPDARMPTITAFTGPEIRALTSYLRSLR